MKPEAISKCVETGILLATVLNRINRGKAFKCAFDTAEQLHGKLALTDGVKKTIRNAIDDKLRERAQLSKTEVLASERVFRKLTPGLQIVRGRQMVTHDLAKTTLETDILDLHADIVELRGKIARSESGYITDAQARQMERLKMAINARLFELQSNGTLSEQMERISAYLNRVEQAKAEAMLAKALADNVKPIVSQEFGQTVSKEVAEKIQSGEIGLRQ